MTDRAADLALRGARLVGQKKLQAFLEATRCMRGLGRGEPTNDGLYSVLWPVTTDLDAHDHLDPQKRMVDGADPFWRTVRRIKDALDPEGILAPGKYSLP